MDPISADPVPQLRLKMLIAYDGRPFRGWQSQAGGDAVQDHVEAAFAKLCGQRLVVYGAGRTDAGVHALGQVAHVDVPVARLPFERWLNAINAHLPPEVRILKITRPGADFHSRFSARGKVYTYRICNQWVMPPLELGRAWHFPSPLDAGILRQCAELLEGTHDFKAFAANRGKPDESTTRTIHEIKVRVSGSQISLRFTGNGFLYRMVRLLTGSMVRCAQGRADLSWIETMLAKKGELKSSFAAPAEGLYLTRVLY